MIQTTYMVFFERQFPSGGFQGVFVDQPYQMLHLGQGALAQCVYFYRML